VRESLLGGAENQPAKSTWVMRIHGFLKNSNLDTAGALGSRQMGPVD